MKALLFVIALTAAAFAQQSPEDEINQCVKSCCYSYGGDWSDSDQACMIDPNDERYSDLSDCELQCVYSGTGIDTGAGAVCCAPGLVLFGLLGVALKGGK